MRSEVRAESRPEQVSKARARAACGWAEEARGGLGLSLPPLQPVKGKLTLLPQSSNLPVGACVLARCWLTRGWGLRLAFPTLEETR